MWVEEKIQCVGRTGKAAVHSGDTAFQSGVSSGHQGGKKTDLRAYVGWKQQAGDVQSESSWGSHQHICKFPTVVRCQCMP